VGLSVILCQGTDQLADALAKQVVGIQDRAPPQDRFGIEGDLQRARLQKTGREPGHLAAARGNWPAARAYHEETLEIWREIDSRWESIHTLGGLGHLARAQQDYPRALSLYRESLAMRLESGDPLLLAMSFEDFATIAARQGQYPRAAQLLGAADALCEPLGKRLPVAVPEEYEQAVNRITLGLGEAAFAAARSEGRTMSLEEATRLCLEPALFTSGRG
jgi:tetratricopeptide (TPR) repeat protein